MTAIFARAVPLVAAALLLAGCHERDLAGPGAAPGTLDGTTYTRVQDERGLPVRHPTVPAVRPR